MRKLKNKIIISGIKYFNKNSEKDVFEYEFEESITISKVFALIGINKEMIGYCLFNGKPFDKNGSIDRSGELKLIPFLSGG